MSLLLTNFPMKAFLSTFFCCFFRRIQLINWIWMILGFSWSFGRPRHRRIDHTILFFVCFNTDCALGGFLWFSYFSSKMMYMTVHSTLFAWLYAARLWKLCVLPTMRMPWFLVRCETIYCYSCNISVPSLEPIVVGIAVSTSSDRHENYPSHAWVSEHTYWKTMSPLFSMESAKKLTNQNRRNKRSRIPNFGRIVRFLQRSSRRLFFLYVLFLLFFLEKMSHAQITYFSVSIFFFVWLNAQFILLLFTIVSSVGILEYGKSWDRKLWCRGRSASATNNHTNSKDLLRLSFVGWSNSLDTWM